MHGVYTVAQVRAAEDELLAELPDGTLMQRAAHALAVQCAGLLDRVYGARIVLLVGSGNNGGDALFAGAELAGRGARVHAVLLEPDRVHARGLRALRRARGLLAGAGEAPALLAAADLVVDGITGIGGHAGLRGAAAELAEHAADRLTVAVDVPSGVDADTGAAGESAISASVTVTFGALKPGLLVGAGAEHAGQVRLVDIGLSLPDGQANVLEAADVAAVLPVPDAADDKYTRGVVGVVAGSPQYGGAAVLATGAALASGAGMVRYLGRAPDAVRARYPEVVVHDSAAVPVARVQAWVLGPGLGTDEAAAKLVAEVLATDVPVVVDADAITLVAARPELVSNRTAPTVLTPHDREFGRLAGDPGDDRLAHVRALAARLGAVVLLKGNATIVAAADGTAFLNTTGTPWLGTAGSGDVLSGMIGTLLAAGMPAALATASAAFLHGVAGQLAAVDGPPTAVDVLDSIRPSIHSLGRPA